MNVPSNGSVLHEEAYAQLGAYSLGALDASEERALLAHVEDCAECAAELEVLKRVVATLPETPEGGEMAPDRSRVIRAALVERAEAGSVRATSDFWKPAAIAASLLVAALGAGYYRELTETRELLRTVAARSALIDSIADIVRQKDEQLAAMTGPGVSIVELSSSAVQAPSARMFWDRATNRWTMYAHGLAALQPGRAYELWLVTAETKIPAGTFKPRPDGSATFTATYALDPSALMAIAVTEEPEAGVPAPTGEIILLGTAAAPR